ncbi:YciI family protein [Pedobacter sp. V48]|uniref:YciI family protein n=1 Tax=Pedobacter sp. V48 TaxID=509635 RepID=UPI0003E5B0B0|nr:YciI family protein [Pedobacter sp. V48]ETZ21573.1 hypothetical protein N824_27955 [Pedobacter sp. V48]
MKKITIMAFLICTVLIYYNAGAQEVNKNYDEKLAKELKADEYGMKKYVLVILKTGSAKDLPKTTLDSIFKGHMGNIGRLVNEGKLIVAGPLGKNDNAYRGIFIFDVESTDEAQKLVETDPVIISKVMTAEYYPWYGSAALKETVKIHSKIEKKSH